MTKSIDEEIKERRASYGQGEAQAVGHPSLNKVYNIWTASMYQVLMMASWTCNIVLYSTVFDIGGPMMLIYSTIIVTFGQCLMMASLGELCSVWPFAGGQQAFTKYLAPRCARRILSYIVGWIVFLAELATSAGCAMNNALTVGTIISLRFPEFEMTNWVTWLMYSAFLVFSILFSISQKHLPTIAVIGGVITLGGGIAWAAAFLAMAPKESAEFVFTNFIDNSGYGSIGWTGVMSFYTPVYALYGTDGILHLTEEMKEPEKNAPKAMIYSMIFSGVTSLMGAMVMGFCSANWAEYMQTDEPYVTWFVDVLGGFDGGAATIIILIVLLNFLIIVGINTAASRLAWSMAIDNAFPMSGRLKQINKTFQTPLNAILLTVGLQILIGTGLVVFGSQHAFETIVSLGGVAIQAGYLIPVLLLLLRGRDFLPATRAYNLGLLGLPINIAAACWSCLIIVILSFPLYVPITPDSLLNMNWAIAVFAVVVVLVVLDWILRASHHYVIEEHVEDTTTA